MPRIVQRAPAAGNEGARAADTAEIRKQFGPEGLLDFAHASPVASRVLMASWDG
jgi:hypothetical protein